MHNGILPITKETFKLLIQKHPDPRKTLPDMLIQGPTRSVHPATFEIDESIIINVSIITKDETRPSGLDVNGWLRI